MSARRAAFFGAVLSVAALAGVDVSAAPVSGPANGASTAAAAHHAPAPAVAAARPGLAGAAGALTPEERRALDIVSVAATGAPDAGLNVTVTFAGDLERWLGRGNLQTGLVGLILRPKDPGSASAYLATRGAGWESQTIRKTQSATVGAVRGGRTLTFFIAGPGAENVASVTVKTFAAFPPPTGAAKLPSVPPEWWEKIAEGIATDEARLENLPVPSRDDSCLALQALRSEVDRLLSNAAARADKVKGVEKFVRSAIPELEDDLRAERWKQAANSLIAIGSGLVTIATVAAGQFHGFSLGLSATVLSLKMVESAKEGREILKEAIKGLKFDLRLVDAYLAANDRLRQRLRTYRDRLDGLAAERCVEVTVKPTWAHNPPLGKSNVCVDFFVKRTGDALYLEGSFTVRLTGPSISANSSEKTPLVEGRGRFIGTITKAGTHTAEIEIFDDSGFRVAKRTLEFLVAEPPQDGPAATPPCPKPTE